MMKNEARKSYLKKRIKALLNKKSKMQIKKEIKNCQKKTKNERLEFLTEVKLIGMLYKLHLK